jgi:small GTP-binding protein
LGLKKKIVLLGDSAVGKTSLIRRYVFDQFEDKYITTIGSKVTMKEIKTIRQKAVNLTFMIWDLIGTEGYKGLHARTLAGVHGAILVTDLTRKETLSNLEKYWIPFLIKVVGSVPMVFACNKFDLKDEFEFEPEELEDIASRYTGHFGEILPDDMSPFYSTSAKVGNNVDIAFETLGQMVMTGKDVKDPVKELYENLIATGICRASDRTKPIGALDAIIIDFCNGFNDSRLAMLILRQEFNRAGIDIANPTKDGILKVVEYLAEAENEFIDTKTVTANLNRRLEWAENVEE